MKLIRLSNEMKQKLLSEYKASLEKEANEKLAKFSVEMEAVVPDQKSEKTENKLTIYYTAEAYAKIVQLVFSHTQEIGWNMVVKKYKNGYRVEDILVYPQKASAAYIEVDTARYGMWRGDPDKVSDEADANLFGQGHSHVNMSTSPSGTDLDQQRQEVQLKGCGFYLFQIWNKRLEINTFFYDIDNNVLYEKDDVELVIEDGNMNSDEFIADSKEMLKTEPKITAIVPVNEVKKTRRRKPKTFDEILAEKIDEEDDDFMYEGAFLDGYWPGYGSYPEYEY